MQVNVQRFPVGGFVLTVEYDLTSSASLMQSITSDVICLGICWIERLINFEDIQSLIIWTYPLPFRHLISISLALSLLLPTVSSSVSFARSQTRARHQTLLGELHIAGQLHKCLSKTTIVD